MKAIKTVSLFLFLALLLASGKMHAQDPMTIGKVYKIVLLENDKVRVMSVVFAPGDEMPMHSHPAHTVYVVDGGTIEITAKDGKPSVMELKAGDAVYMDAVTHTGKNVGKSTIKLVVTEMKN